MKTISVTVEYGYYKNKDEANDDYLVFTCPFKHITAEFYRSELVGFGMLDVLAKEEYDLYSKGINLNSFCMPRKFLLKIEDSDYNYIFGEYLDYSEEEKDYDLRKIFTYIKLKVIEVYGDVKQYEKYCDTVDLIGDATGCEFCMHYHKHDYCTKFNIVEPKKSCLYYSFKKLDK